MMIDIKVEGREGIPVLDIEITHLIDMMIENGIIEEGDIPLMRMMNIITNENLEEIDIGQEVQRDDIEVGLILEQGVEGEEILGVLHERKKNECKSW